MRREGEAAMNDSHGQSGLSDTGTGSAAVAHSDWANNGELMKPEEARACAVAVVRALR